MNRAEVDWRYLATHTLVPALTAVVMLGSLASSTWLLRSLESRYAAISVDQDTMNADYDALVVRKRLVDRYHRRYERFREQGFVGEESRLDWIETLRLVAEDLSLPQLTYSLEPQQPVVAPVPSSSPGSDVQIFVSTLDIEVGLIHEADLLTLVDELQTAAPGLLEVDRCALHRATEPDALRTADSNIVASCSLNMYSVVTSDVGEAAL